MAPNDDVRSPDPDPDPDATDASDASEEHEDPTAMAEDGMAPLINNTGADDAEGEGADASTG